MALPLERSTSLNLSDDAKNRTLAPRMSDPKEPPWSSLKTLPKGQSCCGGLGGPGDRDIECVLGIVAMRRSHFETTVDKILKCMKDLCQGRLKLLWLDQEMLRKDPSEWEKCDILWTLYYNELPLDTLKAYVDRVKPLELNEVAGLMMLTDRIKTLKQCVQFKVAVPKFAVCNRSDGVEPSVEDGEDHIAVDGTRINKPFLEKPVSSKDNDIYIYYPKHAGGGRMRLVSNGWGNAEFVGGRAHVRRTGSHVYQSFVRSEGFELRLFVIGSSYVHADARQQFPGHHFGDSGTAFTPVLLEANEKQLARKVALAFGLRTFNILALRTQMTGTTANLAADGQMKTREVFVHHVDPVDGGIPLDLSSSVIADIAKSLLQEIADHHAKKTSVVKALMASYKRSLEDGDMQSKELSGGRMIKRKSFGDDDRDPLMDIPEEELPDGVDSPKATCVVAARPELSAVLAVFRHGDRTPKQKLKLKLEVAESTEDNSFFLGMISGWILGSNPGSGVDLIRNGPSRKHELRASDQLERLYDLLHGTRELLAEVQQLAKPATEGDLKCSESTPTPTPTPTLPPKASSEADFATQAPTKEKKAKFTIKNENLLAAACKILKKTDDVHAKIEVEKECLKVTLKWGGELTQTGEIQARNLGKKFREAQYSHEDMSQLHASFRHDLKVHSSNEPRCAMTAAAFAQGLLNLQFPLGAIQISFVRMDNLGRLDSIRTFIHSPLINIAKESAREMLESGEPISEEYESRVLCAPERYGLVRAELERCRCEFGTVRKGLEELATAVINLEKELSKLGKSLGSSLKSADAAKKKLCEVLPLIHQRWEETVKDNLKDDPKIVPSDHAATILDSAKYDFRHSVPIIKAGGSYPDVLAAFEEVHRLSSCITAFAEQGQYGTTPEDKFEISRVFLRPMLAKLRFDLRVASGAELGEDWEHLGKHNQLYTTTDPPKSKDGSVQQVRSRLYFAHHSQMQSLLNLFMWAPQRDKFLNEAGQAFVSSMRAPLAYVCHLVLKLWRHPDLPEDERFRVSLELSPGDDGSSADDDAPVPSSTVLHDSIPLAELDRFFTEALEAPPRKDATSAVEATLT